MYACLHAATIVVVIIIIIVWLLFFYTKVLFYTQLCFWKSGHKSNGCNSEIIFTFIKMKRKINQPKNIKPKMIGHELRIGVICFRGIKKQKGVKWGLGVHCFLFVLENIVYLLQVSCKWVIKRVMKRDRWKPTLLETRKHISKLLEILDCGVVLFALPSIGASTSGNCYR